mmetsp:Transcript_12100/g.31051  ORF Transcript_12100/g.31051 Transcript_12100/m.31051 type:complete len:400 (-) Transcript_12100:24-1223(-)
MHEEKCHAVVSLSRHHCHLLCRSSRVVAHALAARRTHSPLSLARSAPARRTYARPGRATSLSTGSSSRGSPPPTAMSMATTARSGRVAARSGVPALRPRAAAPALALPRAPCPALGVLGTRHARGYRRTVARASPEDSTDMEPSKVQQLLYPNPEELDSDFEMPIWDHLEELRERVLVGVLAVTLAIGACFCFSKDLVVFLEAPVASQGVRFLQLSPGEFFFTSLKVSGYTGILVAAPTVLYEIIAYVVPGLTRDERKFLAPVVFGSSILFYAGILFAYEILTPAALNFFVNYADGAVESLWSIDQYFEFVLVLLLSTGLSFQVPVVQVMLGQLGLVSSQQMIALWRYVVVGAVVAAAVLTPSTDPFTQMLLAGPLIGLYMGGAFAVKAIEAGRPAEQS